MAKSKLIRDFVNSDTSIEIALKNLIVILHNFDDKSLENWAKKELRGYSYEDELPNYRKLKGTFLANYIVGNSYNYMKYENHSFPLGSIDPEIKDLILNITVNQSVSTLESIIKDKLPLQNFVPAELFPIIQKGTNAQIISARVFLDTSSIQDVASVISEKILDTLIYLEDQFGNLDDLDIDLSNKTQTEIQQIINQISINLYDKSINIGDNNTIKKSEFVSN